MMAEKKKKKIEYPIGLTDIPADEAKNQMDEFFSHLEKEYKDVPEEELKRGARKIQDYLEGKIGWAELFNFKPEMLFHMAEFGYTQFQVGRYEDAERIFKVLTVLDWNNHYYHSMMGSILQRQKRYGEAIAEYSQAIELYKEDMVSLTHRGEIYLQHGLVKEAKVDLERAVKLDPAGDNRWANRARMLLAQWGKQQKEKVES
ncbi:MAG: tetratricopeptide repeat protein [Deltaproteobacteria bacterium]|nr:tetratricopeptide repeat protein [Deltaproteobacteria bacterium]